MKKTSIFSGLALVTILVLLISCRKSLKTTGVNPKPQLEINGATAGLHVRTGTHLFNNCGGTMPCGPCPGICIEFAALVDSNAVTSEEYQAGERLIYATLIDSTHLKMSFTTPISEGIETSSGYTQIGGDYDIGSDAANALGKTDITILRGNYPIGFSVNSNGDVTFNITSH